MVGERQKNQYELAFMVEGSGEAASLANEGIEPIVAERTTESPTQEQLMEEVCEAENLRRALKRVKSNKGSPGIDGMTVDELSGYLKEHWPTIRTELLQGTYKPQPVKRVEIEKPDGGTRRLGIPTVLDRFIKRRGVAGSPATLGGNILGTLLWLQTRTLRPSSSGPSTAVYRRRVPRRG